MLEQGFDAKIDWIAPIDIVGPPTDLTPPLLCKAGPTLAALGDPTAMPPEYHFGIPLGDLLIAIITVGFALPLACIAWHILTPLLGGKRRARP
jgi:hypothetical protein